MTSLHPIALAALWREARYCFARARWLRHNTSSGETGHLKPTLVQVQTLNRCNGVCIMCPQPAARAAAPRTPMDPSLFDSIIHEMAAWTSGGVLNLSFQNEPFLDERLVDLALRAHRALGAPWEIEITTNGTAIRETDVERLAAAGAIGLNFSVNSHSVETHSVVMPGSDRSAAIRNIEAALAAGIRTTVRFVVVAANAPEYPAFRRHWHGRGVPVLGFEANNRLGSVRDFDRIRLRERSGWLAFVRRCFSPASRGVCLFPFSQINILADGAVLACCNDYTGESRAGSLAGSSLEAIFNGETFRALRGAQRRHSGSGFCGRCSLFQDRTVRGATAPAR